EAAQACSRRSHRALHDTPHRERCLVDGNPDQRSRRTLPGLQRGRALAARGTGDSIRRLCCLAAELPSRRSAGSGVKLLAETVGGIGAAGTAPGLRTPCAGRLPWVEFEFRTLARVDRWTTSAQPAAGRNTVYDVAGVLSDLALAIQWPGGDRG